MIVSNLWCLNYDIPTWRIEHAVENREHLSIFTLSWKHNKQLSAVMMGAAASQFLVPSQERKQPSSRDLSLNWDAC